MSGGKASTVFGSKAAAPPLSVCSFFLIEVRIFVIWSPSESKKYAACPASAVVDKRRGGGGGEGWGN